ncbi:metal-dependent hydrolase [Erythrobacter sp. LQ02-29]|uniref:metal-dependent hydrolase n=1 Tax=Erythrobacter sp. LQ02-29 TaxID=2920384 RepID=UPI001F4E161B|nr:metal-dependent hydrolase [Erythrobacter sp. LQ02-29]MCP9223037.1 metal-dependent hydrolase [Erythrobacter sp. LQ02-29]
MDNLTHSLVGALLGQASLKRRTGLAMPALIIGANLPDVDATCVIYGTESLAMRRGLTHGPLALVMLPVVLATVLYAFDRWQARGGTRPEGRLPVRFGWLVALSFLACLTHPALDWLNVYGIRLLAPFSQRWFHGDTLFIVDWVLWLVMGFATWLSWRRDRHGLATWRRPARYGLAFLGIYIALNGILTGMAERVGAGLAPEPTVLIASPAPGQPWKRDIIFADSTLRWYRVGWTPLGLQGQPLMMEPNQCPVEVADLPRSPAIDAFLFWSRAPLFARGDDGAVTLYDARFYDPRARGRFAVTLPGLQCERPPAP